MRSIALVALAACTGVQQRFPDDVMAAVAHQPMRRLETDRFIIYYPAPRAAEVQRFALHATRCAEELRADARIKTGRWAEKMVIVMPDVAFNNAFVIPELGGYEQKSVIPLQATIDFATEYGLVPDPSVIACHELAHYVQFQQLGGFWEYVDSAFGHLYTPQTGYDPWFDEGVATHYEAKLTPGSGRPSWPLFTGVFAAAYAGEHVGGGDMSSLGREAPMGHHYLVGSMFVKFLAARYGERALWGAIADEAHALTGWFFTGTFDAGFGRTFGQLLDEFDAWVHAQFPVRAIPPTQHQLGAIGNDARYARGRDGTEAWVADDVDVPTRLTVRDASARVLAEIPLVDLVPPRTLVQASPLLVSGLSITATGEVWLTAVDLGATYQVTRLLRWRRGEDRLTEIATDLGPGATIDPTGGIYYYCAVDGDRWSLAAYDLRTRARRTILDMQPGTYVLGAQVSPDGTHLAASVWDGSGFRVWVIAAVTGQIEQVVSHGSSPVYDPSFFANGSVMYLGEVAGRFQIFLGDKPISDVPYAAVAPREANGTIRFLDREKWEWELAEIVPRDRPNAPAPAPDAPAPVLAPVRILTDSPYCHFDHLWFPQERAPTLLVPGNGKPLYGLVVAGGDRLELQRWSLAGYAQPRGEGSTRTHYGGDVAYLNAMAAPFLVLGELSWLDFVDQLGTADPNVTMPQERRTRDASLSLSRTWRGEFTAALAGIYTDDFAEPVRRHVGGPSLSLEWAAAETTRYTGTRRGAIATAAAALYPHALSTFASNITDVGGSLEVVAPLPLGRRHVVSAKLRGRALLSPMDTGLLQVGGDAGIGSIWNRSSSTTAPPSFDDSRFPPNLRFIEPLRGYEDYAITTDRAALGDVSWRYPIIIDRGVAATAWVLPASFVREFDLELFGAGGVDRANALHAAGGGALTLRIQVLRIPLAVTYQLARRFADDRAVTQLVAVAPDL